MRRSGGVATCMSLCMTILSYDIISETIMTSLHCAPPFAHKCRPTGSSLYMIIDIQVFIYRPRSNRCEKGVCHLPTSDRVQGRKEKRTPHIPEVNLISPSIMSESCGNPVSETGEVLIPNVLLRSLQSVKGSQNRVWKKIYVCYVHTLRRVRSRLVEKGLRPRRSQSHRRTSCL